MPVKKTKVILSYPTRSEKRNVKFETARHYIEEHIKDFSARFPCELTLTFLTGMYRERVLEGCSIESAQTFFDALHASEKLYMKDMVLTVGSNIDEQGPLSR